MRIHFEVPVFSKMNLSKSESFGLEIVAVADDADDADDDAGFCFAFS